MRTAIAILLCVFLVVLPVRASVALRNVALWSAVLLLAWLAWREHRVAAILPARRVLLPMLVLAAWCAASVAWSVMPMASASELRPEVLTPLAAFLAFHAATDSPEALDRWAAALVAGLGGLAAAAFVQHALEGAWNPRELHVDVGYYSTHVAMALPLAAWLWLRRPRTRDRIAVVVAVVATLVTLYWTDNRIVWPTLAAMAVAGALLAARGADSRTRMRLAALAAAAIAVAACVFIAAQHERNAMLARAEAHATADFATDPRLRIWPQAFERWKEAPLLGRGFGRPVLALPPGTPYDGIQDPRVWHAHNVFLDVALELGVAGVALFAAVIAMLALEAARALGTTAPRRWAAIAALASLLAFLMKNFPDDFFLRHVALLSAALAGAYVGALRTSPASPR